MDIFVIFCYSLQNEGADFPGNTRQEKFLLLICIRNFWMSLKKSVCLTQSLCAQNSGRYELNF